MFQVWKVDEDFLNSTAKEYFETNSDGFGDLGRMGNLPIQIESITTTTKTTT